MALRAFCVALAFALLGAFSVFSAGCKYTDVLTEHIEDTEYSVLDENAPPIYRETEDAPEDEDRTSTFLNDTSQRRDDQQQALPQYSVSADPTLSTKNRDQTQVSANRQNASTGNETSNSEGDNSEPESGDVQSTQSTGTNDPDESDSSGNNNQTGTGDNSGETENIPTGGAGGDAEHYDATGQTIELPQGVSTVAAAGQYATIVQMLAGQGALVASDDAWIASVAESGVFPGEGVGNVAVGWTANDDGTYAIDLDAIADAAPDVLLTDGSFTALEDEQEQYLIQLGIDVVVVPVIGTSDAQDDEITRAVQVVGELLSGASGLGQDPAALSQSYMDLHDRVIDYCKNSNGGYSYKMVAGTSYRGIYQGNSPTGRDTTKISNSRVTTAYIAGWTTDVNESSLAVRQYSNATMYLNGEVVDASEGAGLSATNASQNFLILDYYLQVAGVVNNAYENALPITYNSDGSSEPFLVVAGDTRNLITETTAASSRRAPSALWYSVAAPTYTARWTLVGDSSYPGIIVANAEYAQNVIASAAKVNGLYNVGQPYKVYVMPQGFAGSWADGTPESFLCSAWAYCIFQSDEDLSLADEYAREFYETFYRVDSTGQIDGYGDVYEAECPTE